jgi:uncharacterized membrane protein
VKTDPLPSKLRLQPIDVLRGLVMILMALDHTRDFFHSGAMSFQPEDLARTTTVLFFTRWITHICAPVFMFTAGLGAFLRLNRGGPKSELSAFLWKRGLWLVFLELTVVRFAFSFGSGPAILNVLWALGWSMVALSLLVHLPVRVLAVVSLLAIALHNLADPVRASQFGAASWIWNLLHQSGAVDWSGVVVVIAYPLVPWVAVMAAGFCFGRVVIPEARQRRKWIARIGLGATAAFLVLRAINLYGDPQPWSRRIPGMTVLSFLRCTKYPPSLDFLLMTLGPALLLLVWLERVQWTPANPLIVFGRVPLFYFIVHLYIIRLLTIPFAFLRYGQAGFLLYPLPSIGGTAKLYPPGFGFPLWVVYAVWAAVVAMLYPLCVWFGGLKQRRKDWWLSYF